MATATKTKADEWMMKDDAAKLLGTNPRSIERLARQGKVARNYLPRLPHERQARVVYSRGDLHEVLKGEASANDPVTKQPSPISSQSTALVIAKSVEGQADSWGALARTLGKIEERLNTPPAPRAIPKQWMTLDEAAEYCGLPLAELERLCREGLLFTFGRGPKTWRIQRAALDAFGRAAHQ